MDTSVLPIIILLPLILGTTLVSLLQRFSRGVTALGAIGVSLTSFGLLLTQAKTVLWWCKHSTKLGLVTTIRN